jgi:hypothetical protein
MPSDGTTTQRGYDYQHKKLRKQYEPHVRSGQATCWRCLANGLPPEQARIKPGDDWDLGHDDHQLNPDGTRKVRGPEHIACNRATAGRHTALTGPPVDTSRRW